MQQSTLCGARAAGRRAHHGVHLCLALQLSNGQVQGMQHLLAVVHELHQLRAAARQVNLDDLCVCLHVRACFVYLCVFAAVVALCVWFDHFDSTGSKVYVCNS